MQRKRIQAVAGVFILYFRAKGIFTACQRAIGPGRELDGKALGEVMSAVVFALL